MTADIETMLRETFTAKADEITESGLSARSLDDAAVIPLSAASRRHGPGRGRAAFAVAAAAFVIAGTAVVVQRGRDDGASVQTPTAPPALEPMAQAWPLDKAGPIETPDGAAHTYLRDVVGLPADWPVTPAEVDGDTAVVHYTLQDVPASVTLRRTEGGSWFVIGAETELVRPVLTARNHGEEVRVDLRNGPRTYAGAKARVVAVGADGLDLAAAFSPVGTSGVSLTWPGMELAVAVRVDVMDDHDGDATTKDVVVGHWTTGIAPPPAVGLPPQADLAAGPPVFAMRGAADDVVEAYIRARFPDFPSAGEKVVRTRFRQGLGYATWSAGDAHDRITGRVFLRRVEGLWEVVAATTDGVDMGGIQYAEGRVRGDVTTTNINSLFADVLALDGTPVAASRRPDGAYPDTPYLFGTAAGPADKRLAVDVAADEEAVIVRVNLVGGTILSVAEAAIRSR